MCSGIAQKINGLLEMAIEAPYSIFNTTWWTYQADKPGWTEIHDFEGGLGLPHIWSVVVHTIRGLGRGHTYISHTQLMDADETGSTVSHLRIAADRSMGDRCTGTKCLQVCTLEEKCLWFCVVNMV